MIFHCMHLVCVELLDDVFLLAVSGLSFALHFVCFSLCRLMIFSFCVDFGEVVLRFAFLHIIVIDRFYIVLFSAREQTHCARM